MSSKSEQVFHNLKKSEQKFEYFMLGITVALFAYIGEKYKPEPISISQNTFELLALIFLVISIYAGFKRIEKNITSQTLNFNKLHAGEKLNSLKKAMLVDQPQIGENGEIFNPQKAIAQIQHIEKVAMPKYTSLTNDISKKGIWFYKIRNWGLILSFILLIISKIVGAYLSKS